LVRLLREFLERENRGTQIEQLDRHATQITDTTQPLERKHGSDCQTVGDVR
jgi:hypothetical protein